MGQESRQDLGGSSASGSLTRLQIKLWAGDEVISSLDWGVLGDLLPSSLMLAEINSFRVPGLRAYVPPWQLAKGLSQFLNIWVSSWSSSKHGMKSEQTNRERAKRQQITSVGEDVEKRELLCIISRSVNWCCHYGR